MSAPDRKALSRTLGRERSFNILVTAYREERPGGSVVVSIAMSCACRYSAKSGSRDRALSTYLLSYDAPWCGPHANGGRTPRVSAARLMELASASEGERS